MAYTNKHLKFVFIYLNKSYKKMKTDIGISHYNIANWLKINKLKVNVNNSNLLVLTQEKRLRKKLLLSYLLMIRN